MLDYDNRARKPREGAGSPNMETENLKNPYKSLKDMHLSSAFSLISISKLLKIGNKSSFAHFLAPALLKG